MIKLFKNFFKKDTFVCYIPYDVIFFTEKILKEYGEKKVPNEGLVYWCGIKEHNRYKVKMVIAPKTKSNQGRVETNHISNFYVVRIINKYGLVHLGQVHSHPGNFTDHSLGDNQWTAFKVNNLISIVVPDYGIFGMQSLKSCGTHVYQDNKFRRLSKKQVKKQFKLIKTDKELFFIDLR